LYNGCKNTKEDENKRGNCKKLAPSIYEKAVGGFL
jgi:hypothetical protein